MGLYITNLIRLRHMQSLFIITIASIITYLLWLFVSYTNAYNSFYFFYNKNLLGVSLLYTGIICGILVFILSDVRVFFNKSLNALLLISFIISIWLFINEGSAINLFLIYELFLLPSFYLVYRLSPNRRAIIASIYFLTWTQFGSLLVLIAIVLSFKINGYFTFGTYSLNKDYLIFWLIFFGFGIKIPMWPFYYWLTKTHVEASSFFSMYLSGFLVKTAVFLFIKFYSIFNLSNFYNLPLILLLIGVIDSSIKMWHQTDLKKLIAYTTVQEMNFLCIPILWNDAFGEALVAIFIATHCLLSCIFFFFIDVISKRFNTRVSSQIVGLVHVMPTFSLIIFLSWVLFSGLPYTIKFLLEIGIFTVLYNHNFLLAIVALIAMNVIGLVGFSKNIFNALFGAPVVTDFIIYDLTKRETILYLFFLINLVVLNSFTLLVW